MHWNIIVERVGEDGQHDAFVHSLSSICYINILNRIYYN